MKVRFWETERIAAIARVALAAALLLALLLSWQRGTGLVYRFLTFVFLVYMGYAVVILQGRHRNPGRAVRLALAAGDVALLLVVVLFAPMLPAAFLLFFLYFAVVAGLWEGWKSAAILSLVVAVIYLGFQGGEGEGFSLSRIAWEGWGVSAALMATGCLVGAAAEFEQRRLSRRDEMDELASLLNLNAGWDALWERFLRALKDRFGAGRAILAFRHPETDRMQVWMLPGTDGSGRFEYSDRPPRDAATFLMSGEVSAGFYGNIGTGSRWHWHGLGVPSAGTGDGSRFTLPERLAFEFLPESLLTAPIVVEGDWRGRIFLLDSVTGSFHAAQLADLEAVLDTLEPNLSSLLAIRGAISRSLSQERERIVRELHDSVAQTLASIEMQLAVFRRQAEKSPQQLADELARLQQAVGRERDDFRRFLRDLKPLRVPPGELDERLLAHCAQFQQETGMRVELQTQPLDGRVGEGVCREVFLILREALHNARKHSGAKRVSVDVRQQGDILVVSISDNGRGFPFSGSFGHRALREQGLAPVALWERVDHLGGELHIESGGAAGTRLRVEIPLN